MSLFVVIYFAISCERSRELIGTFSFCNEVGNYVEISFAAKSEVIVCSDWHPAGKTYTYKIERDSMFTYDPFGRKVSECRIVSFFEAGFEIAYSDSDSTYHFTYARISDNPIIAKQYSDTTSQEYHQYRKGYLERKERKGCIIMREPATIDFDQLDSLSDTF